MSELSQLWESFSGDFEARNQRLIEELQASWQDLAGLLDAVEPELAWAGERKWEAGKLDSLRALFGEAANRMLLAPLARNERLRPQGRALAAIEDHRAALDDLTRHLPATLEVIGRELAETVGPLAAASWRSYPLRWRRKPRPAHVRAASRLFLQSWQRRQAKLQGELLLWMAQASLALIDPWQALRDEALRCLDGSGSDPKEYESDCERWLALKQRLRQRAERTLGRLRARVGESQKGLAGAWLRSTVSPETANLAQPDPLTDYGVYWSRQRAAILAQHDIERRLIELGGLSAEETERTVDSIETEHGQLLQELEAFGGWLEGWQPGQTAALPSPIAELVSAEDRVRYWAAAISRRSNAVLHASIETIEPRRALPGWRQRWGQIRLAPAFQAALGRVGTAEYVSGLKEAEGIHRRTLREIERAREVVTYGLEVGHAGEPGGEQIARESVENAKSLVAFQKKKTRPLRRLAEASLVEALAAAFSQCYGAVEEGRFGLWSRLARQRGRRTAAYLFQRGGRYGQEGSRLLWDWGQTAYRGALIEIGLERQRDQRLDHVTRRAALEVDDRTEVYQQLPMIYRRLFRLEPVQDPRFLVGREAEMAALTEARERWNAAKPVSVVLIGERGSGKSSLLNCATVRVFSGVEPIRASLCERILDAAQMDAFLRQALQLPADADLLESLRAERRVILLEEVERAFLRRVDGFDALRRLLSLVADSCRTTLWVLCLNQLAFKFLNAAVGVEQVFSHRINAMSVEPEHLKNAILLRHNLSGLRLRFARPPSRHPLVERLRRPLGLDRRAREAFFDALYQQSEGVFRSAFELWHRYIDSAHGGVLRMRFPDAVDADPLITGLGREDLFTLQAVLQHGGLTFAECAQVFCIPEHSARARIEGLLDRGILEREPGAPGWRVRSEAGYLVRKALDRQNLL
ncbi:MAG: ATP-binding protein [Bryobacterales bacterium]